MLEIVRVRSPPPCAGFNFLIALKEDQSHPNLNGTLHGRDSSKLARSLLRSAYPTHVFIQKQVPNPEICAE
ncbi:3292_t:CDS:2 [Paraglomus occultum]|uniref:3292_t:CDS:1 n=1 Tax=Paraglomus occultum TaxID=144539 RepID=A0A9N9B2R0_9GLOM|nr:3292_t:CDS:2 [Paraglomus occultum]